jgi:hypothetical protein
MRLASGPAAQSPCSGAFALKEARMPAEARGHVRKLPSGKWQLRYYDGKGCATPVAHPHEVGGVGALPGCR